MRVVAVNTDIEFEYLLCGKVLVVNRPHLADALFEGIIRYYGEAKAYVFAIIFSVFFRILDAPADEMVCCDAPEPRMLITA